MDFVVSEGNHFNSPCHSTVGPEQKHQGGGSQSIWISGLGNEVDGGLMARVSKVPFM